MSQPITRLYAQEKDANEAVSELKKAGFASQSIALVTPQPSEGEDTLAADLVKAGLSRSAASTYAQRVRDGGSVVSITPNFGSALRATQILDRFHPIDAGLSTNEATASAGNASSAQTVDASEAAPLSAKLKWPVLLDNAAPFSSYFKWPVLSDQAAPLSEKANWSVLSSDPAPFSGWLKWPLLSDKASPFSDWLNLPVLLRDPTPVSTERDLRT